MPAEQIPARFEELLAALVAESRYGNSEADGGETSTVQRNLWTRHSILRRLFDEPVLYQDDLSVEQRDYLASPTGRQILRRSAEQAGFVLEERAEGYLLVDPEAIATDETFPEGGSTVKVTALHLLDHLQPPGQSRSRPELVAVAQQLLDSNSKWALSHRGDDGPRTLTGQAVDLLVTFGLVREAGAGDVIAAAARYEIEVTAAEPAQPERTTSS